MTVTNMGLTVNLVNSIVGVSLLTMPFCFKECGIILGSLLLLFCAWMTHQSCIMLVKTAVATKRRTYVGLAYQAYGTGGKFFVEASMIGLMLGTCIAFYVVIADLSSSFLSRTIMIPASFGLRALILLFVASAFVLPISLQRNLMSSAQSLSALALIFYSVFVFVVVLLALPRGLLSGKWWESVSLCRWGKGLFHSYSIFSMAFGCQSQILPTYDTLEEPSVNRMNKIFTNALKIVYILYVTVGFFGYVTFTDNISGNVLVNFPSNFVTEVVRCGFVMSVAVSFPLMILPCRQAVNTLFFEKQQKDGTFVATGFMPALRFKVVTAAIVYCTMAIAVFIPKVETILGLTGATMGTLIYFVCPALIYKRLHKNSIEAQVVLWVGLVVLVMSTLTALSPLPMGSPPENPALAAGPLDKLHGYEVQLPATSQPVEPNVNEKPAMQWKDKPGVEVAGEGVANGIGEGRQLEKPDLPEEQKEQPKEVEGQLEKDQLAKPKHEPEEHRHEPPVPRDGVLVQRGESDGDNVQRAIAGEDLEMEKQEQINPDGRKGQEAKNLEQPVIVAEPKVKAVAEKREIGKRDEVVVARGADIQGDVPNIENHHEDQKKEEKKKEENILVDLPQLENRVIGTVNADVARVIDAQVKSDGKDELVMDREKMKVLQPNAEEAGVGVAAAAGAKQKDIQDVIPEQPKMERRVERAVVKMGDEGRVDRQDAPPEGRHELLELIKEQQEQQKRLLEQQVKLLAVIEEQHKEMHHGQVPRQDLQGTQVEVANAEEDGHLRVEGMVSETHRLALKDSKPEVDGGFIPALPKASNDIEQKKIAEDGDSNKVVNNNHNNVAAVGAPIPLVSRAKEEITIANVLLVEAGLVGEETKIERKNGVISSDKVIPLAMQVKKSDEGELSKNVDGLDSVDPAKEAERAVKVEDLEVKEQKAMESRVVRETQEGMHDRVDAQDGHDLKRRRRSLDPEQRQQDSRSLVNCKTQDCSKEVDKPDGNMLQDRQIAEGDMAMARQHISILSRHLQQLKKDEQ
uniref:solute carrier family 38 member 10 isoform X2 n=1 Tax=Myxine glutinosa TaxID=7769 RepID=UPI00358F9660